MMQGCNVCKLLKPISEYEHQKDRPNPRKTCKTCRYAARDFDKEKARHREYSRQRRKEKAEQVRQSWERSVYGVSKEELGCSTCQICSSQERLCIGHDHTTGVVRGVLCSRCNSGLGFFKDSVESLKAAMEYVKKFNELKG